MSSLRAFQLDKRLFNPTLYSSLLNFWFKGLPANATAPSNDLISKWFGVNISAKDKLSFDNGCASNYQSPLESIGPKNLSLPSFTDVDRDRQHHSDIASPFVGQFKRGNTAAGGDPDAALGLMLLLDQMPRNIYRRNQELIYGHYDRISRAVLTEISAQKLDRHKKYRLSPVHRQWFYLPLMHSESMEDHKLLFEFLTDDWA